MPGAAKASRLFLPIPENMSAPGIEEIFTVPAGERMPVKNLYRQESEPGLERPGEKQNMEDCF